MAALLDVNVLVALAWLNHVHHAASAAWFAEHREAGWATTPLTETGFVRVSSNPSISAGTVSFAASPEVVRDQVHGHRQVTGAHLLALAAVQDGRLVTFDRGTLSLGHADRVLLLSS